MKAIPLTKGMVALVDDADYAFLMHWKWHASFNKGSFYAIRTERHNGKRRTVHMARVIMGVTAKSQEVDHINRSSLDNQRSNLRVGTHHLNCVNQGKRINNTSGFKGVYWDKAHGKWRFAFRATGKLSTTGRFDSIEEAARAYDAAALRTWGDHAITNLKLGLLPDA